MYFFFTSAWRSWLDQSSSPNCLKLRSGSNCSDSVRFQKKIRKIVVVNVIRNMQNLVTSLYLFQRTAKKCILWFKTHVQIICSADKYFLFGVVVCLSTQMIIIAITTINNLVCFNILNHKQFELENRKWVYTLGFHDIITLYIMFFLECSIFRHWDGNSF